MAKEGLTVGEAVGVYNNSGSDIPTPAIVEEINGTSIFLYSGDCMEFKRIGTLQASLPGQDFQDILI